MVVDHYQERTRERLVMKRSLSAENQLNPEHARHKPTHILYLRRLDTLMHMEIDQ